MLVQVTCKIPIHCSAGLKRRSLVSASIIGELHLSNGTVHGLPTLCSCLWTRSFGVSTI